jgi:hypothetical protein
MVLASVGSMVRDVSSWRLEVVLLLLLLPAALPMALALPPIGRRVAAPGAPAGAEAGLQPVRSAHEQMEHTSADNHARPQTGGAPASDIEQDAL